MSIVEGGSRTVNLTAHGNPAVGAYVWFKDDQLFTGSDNAPIKARGSSLIIHGIRRAHAGVYVCQSENEEGRTNFSLTVDVQCKFCRRLISLRTEISCVCWNHVFNFML